MSVIAQFMEVDGGSSCRSLAHFPELPLFVLYHSDLEYAASFCDSDGDKSFTLLAVVRPSVKFGTIVNPD
jgi:hypothetical protein